VLRSTVARRHRAADEPGGASSAEVSAYPLVTRESPRMVGAAAARCLWDALPWCRLGHIGNNFAGVGVHEPEESGKVPRSPGTFPTGAADPAAGGRRRRTRCRNRRATAG